MADRLRRRSLQEGRSASSGAADSHAEEGAIDESEGDEEKGGGEDMGEAATGFGGEFDGEFDGEEAEESREFDDRVEGDGGSVFKGVADGVAHDSGVAKGE